MRSQGSSMCVRKWKRSILVALYPLITFLPLRAQVFPFSSGQIPLCDTSLFYAQVDSIDGLLSPPGGFNTFWIQAIEINISTDHPQTLSISITSPEGTTLVLSSFNGAGGFNYTNTAFTYSGDPSITLG